MLTNYIAVLQWTPPDENLPFISARWQVRQAVDSFYSRQYSQELRVDVEPPWEGRKPWAHEGVKARKQKECNQKIRQTEELNVTSSQSSSL